MKIYEKRVDDVRKLYATEAEYLTENDTDVTGSFNFAGKYYYAPPGKIVDGSGNELTFETTNVRFVPHPVHVKTDDEKVQPKEVLFEDSVTTVKPDDVPYAYNQVSNFDLSGYDSIDVTVDGTKYTDVPLISVTIQGTKEAGLFGGWVESGSGFAGGYDVDLTEYPFAIMYSCVENQDAEIHSGNICTESAGTHDIKIEG